MQLLEAGNQKLDPRSNLPTEGAGPARAERPAGRYVLIGGPGQGKTTVSQFMAQLYRAALLNSRKELTGEAQIALKDILTQCAEESLSLPSARRFPLVVVLNDFAKALASETGPNSLLTYLVDRVKQRTDQNVSAKDFRAWLGAYSFVLTLDGLDEVPASSNRHEVLSAIRDFMVDIADANADVLILTTTRPQGYNEDFSPKLFSHIWLEPLSSRTALHYAQKPPDNQYGADVDRKNKVLGRLRRAVDEEATRRLMRSPLQVTIMATLVDQGGPPPQERWNLFDKYYDVIYKREVERDIPAAAILSGYQPDINAIHKRVGLVLQIESERIGGTDARLSLDRVSEIVEARLSKEEHQGADLKCLKELILEAATQRLVFLVSPQEGQVGFEIRSLQEFMAGEAIMEGADREVQDRLRAIARYAHWRNVFLFASGHSFFNKQRLRDTLIAICTELNDDPDDEMAHVTLAGSRLAMDLLEEGSARRQPLFARALARVALRILERPVNSIHRRLALAYYPLLESVFREEILPRLTDTDSDRAHPAWAALVGLADAGIEWAGHEADRSWPRRPAAAADLAATLLQDQQGPSWAAKHLRALVAYSGPVESNYWTQHPNYRNLYKTTMRRSDWLYDTLFDRTLTPSMEIRIRTRDGNPTRAIAYTNAISAPLFTAVPTNLDRYNKHWRMLRFGAELADDPTKERLARQVEWCAANVELLDNVPFYYLPWVTQTALHFGYAEGLQGFASKIRSGMMREGPDWFALEQRWRAHGFSIVDLDDIDENAAVMLPRIFSHPGERVEVELIEELVDLLVRIKRPAARTVIGDLIISMFDQATRHLSASKFSGIPADRRPIVVPVNSLKPDKKFISSQTILTMLGLTKGVKQRHELLDRFGVVRGLYYLDAGDGRALQAECCRAFRDGARSAGVLRLIALLAGRGVPHNLEASQVITLSSPNASTRALIEVLKLGASGSSNLDINVHDLVVGSAGKEWRGGLYRWSGEEEVLHLALNIMDRQDRTDKEIERVLFDLYDYSPKLGADLRRRIGGILNKVYAKRTSPLCGTSAELRSFGL